MPKHTKRKQSGPKRVDGRKCTFCAAEVTPQWRKAIRGEETFEACNRCGISHADLIHRIDVAHSREPTEAEYLAWEGSRSSSSNSAAFTDEDEGEAADALLRLSESPIFVIGTLHGSPEPLTGVEAVPITSTSSNNTNSSPPFSNRLFVEIGPAATANPVEPALETDATPSTTNPARSAAPALVSYFPALGFKENRGFDEELIAHLQEEQRSPPSPSFEDWVQ